MFNRVKTVTIALVFGLIATGGAALYINSVRAGIVESGIKETGYLVSAPIAAGTSVEELLDQGLVDKKEIPRRYLAEDALTDLSKYKNRIVSVPVSRGEQLTLAKLRPMSHSEIAHKLDNGKVALSIPVDAVTGVNGKIETGDKVIVLVMLEPGPGGSDVSRALLSGVDVIDVGTRSDQPAAPQTKQTITLAVTPAEAEKLVFAEEKGKVWVALSPPSDEDSTPTAGQTLESIFK